MIIKEIKGYEYTVGLGETTVKEVLKEELSDEAMDFVARIEETANDIIMDMHTEEELNKRELSFAQDILMEMYNYIKTIEDVDVLKYIDDTYKKLEEWKNG